MKCKKVLLGLTIINSLVFVLALVLSNSKPSLFINANANSDSYRIEFNKDKNKFTENSGDTAYDGTANPETNLHNKKEFTYYQLKGVASTWQVLGDNGYFYNVEPIHGIKTITLTFNTTSANYQILYSGDNSFDQVEKLTTPDTKSKEQVFNFNSFQPNYFKVLNTSGSNFNISSLVIDFSCLDNYPTLTLTNENPDMGSISGGGIMTAGEKRTITATPNKGYKFVGWYCNGKSISDNASYTFYAGNDDLIYSAKFTYESYNLIVQSENEEKGTVSESTGSYNYLTSITIEATANDGYTFDGWYSGSTQVSKDNPYTFNMPYSNTTYTAKFATNSYEVKLTNANSDLGTITGNGSYLFKNSVTLTASPNTGVSFLGWYDGDDELVSSLATYTFDMPHKKLEYTAKFAWTPYTVELNVNDSSMGSVTGAGSYIYKQEVKLEATPVEHHSFAGWYDGDSLVSMDNPYTFNLPNKSLNYTAKFVKNYTITVYSDNEDMGSVSAPSEWGEGLEVTITASAEVGYALDYWYDNDTLDEISKESSYSFTMPSEDVSYGAAFTTGYTLTVTSSDETKGTVSGGGQYVVGRTATITMNYISGTFKGWYDGDNLVSKSNPYSFEMPAANISYEAKFMTKAEEEEEERNKKLGITPVFGDDNTTVTYGLYPQTHVNDSDTINALNAIITPESNGWYLYNDEYYARKSANPYNSSYTFNDGTTIKSGTTYWFKCEPIKWKILVSSDSTYSLVSTVLLDAHRYASSSNNYKNSEIRTWLNDDFLNSAFKLDSSLIQTTTVDNSASTTNSSSNTYACENTEDKIYLLSYKDYINTSYFSNNSGRMCKTTDYARANGVWYSTSSSYYYNGYYWTRSPDSNYSDYAWHVDYDGNLYDYYFVSYSDGGVRPALTINL